MSLHYTNIRFAKTKLNCSPTATKQRWQPASQVVQVKDLPAVEEECARTTPTKTRGMNNQELIRTLNRDHLLSVVELLSRSLMCPDEDFDELSDEIFFCLDDEVLDYLKTLTEYDRLKLMQLIINTLIYEAEQSAVRHFQALLPLEAES